MLQISGMGVTNNIRQTDTKGKCYKVAWSEWASPREKFSILKPFSKSRSYEDRSLHRTTRRLKKKNPNHEKSIFKGQRFKVS